MTWALWFSKAAADSTAGGKAPVGSRVNVGYCLGLDDKGRVQQYTHAIAGEFSSVAAASAEEKAMRRKGAECVAVTEESPVCLVNTYGEIQPAGRVFCLERDLPQTAESIKGRAKSIYEPELKLFK